MKLKVLFALAAPSLLASGTLYADKPQGGVWSGVHVIQTKICTAEACPPSGRVIYQLSAGAIGAPPTCSSSYRNFVAVDVSKPSGVAVLEVLDRSKFLQQTVSITGTGTCSLDPAIESVATLATDAMDLPQIHNGPPQRQ